jgi:hypothetical protein
MMNVLTSLVYTSKSRLTGDATDIQASIGHILESAYFYNRRRGITGALLFSRGYFAQILEGPRVEVEATYEDITLDARHQDLCVVHVGPIPQRSFPNWLMAYCGGDGTPVAHSAAGLALPVDVDIGAAARGRTFLDALVGYMHDAARADEAVANLRRKQAG